jgi:hypothetical protein
MSNRSQPEKRFEKWLGVQFDEKRIEWWWKNGNSRDEKYLGVPYLPAEVAESGEGTMYPDYLVMTTDGVVWVLEVKDVNDRDSAPGGETSAKAMGLQVWALEMNVLRSAKPGFDDLAEVRAAVAVPDNNHGQGVSVFVGSPAAWTEPTQENLSIGAGWSPLIFPSTPKS